MIETTIDPRQFRLRITEWDRGQPDENTGVGDRSVIVCLIEFPKKEPGLRIRYLYHEGHTRETTGMNWRHTGNIVTPLTTTLAHIIRGALVMDLIESMGPVTVVQGDPVSQLDTEDEEQPA